MRKIIRTLVAIMVTVSVSSFAEDIPKIKITDGNQLRSGYFMIVEKNGGEWRVVSISENSPSLDGFDKKNQEILIFSPNLQTVEPYYSKYATVLPNSYHILPHSGTRYYQCMPAQSDKRPLFNPCDSSFSSITNVGTGVAVNALLGVFTLGIGTLAAGGAMTDYEVDDVAVQKVLDATDAINVMTAFKIQAVEANRLKAYRLALQRAESTGSLRQFIEKYRNNDPENLVSEAQTKLAGVEEKEKADALFRYRKEFQTAETVYGFQSFIDNYSQNDPDKLVPKAQSKLNVLLAQEKIGEEKARRAQIEEGRKLSMWRQSLRDGDETNCGPVIEVKGKLLKIAFAVANYGNEHWIRRDQIFSSSYGCSFVNGQYQTPNL